MSPKETPVQRLLQEEKYSQVQNSPFSSITNLYSNTNHIQELVVSSMRLLASVSFNNTVLISLELSMRLFNQSKAALHFKLITLNFFSL